MMYIIRIRRVVLSPFINPSYIFNKCNRLVKQVNDLSPALYLSSLDPEGTGTLVQPPIVVGCPNTLGNHGWQNYVPSTSLRTSSILFHTKPIYSVLV